MNSVERAEQIVRASNTYNFGKFYGEADGLPLGVGLVFDNIRMPAFDASNRVFDTVAGLVYVLTHECDVDQNNERQFNDKVLVCPIIKLEALISEYADSGRESTLMGMLPAIAAGKVYRVIYFPAHSYPELIAGGILNLNQITSTSVSEFASPEAKAVCSLSEYAQQIFDFKLQNHLLRPKSAGLPRLA